MSTPPANITLHKKSAVLEVSFDAGPTYRLPLEYLRVFSPSAEVRGHGGPMQLVTGRKNIGVVKIEPVGSYAIQLHFDDGHNTGIYSWDTLRDLGENHASNWQEYLARLEAAGASRDA